MTHSHVERLRAPATIDDEGLADAAAANPFRLLGVTRLLGNEREMLRQVLSASGERFEPRFGRVSTLVRGVLRAFCRVCSHDTRA